MRLEEEKKKSTHETETSMACAETEDEELSFIQARNMKVSKKPSKKIIFNAKGNDSLIVKEVKSNNFFKDSIVSPKARQHTQSHVQRPASSSVVTRSLNGYSS